MKTLSASVSLILLLLGDDNVANAIRISARSTRRMASNRLDRRTIHMTGTSGNSSVSVRDLADSDYRCNITLGGQQFDVEIDTGSSDLWIAGDVPGTTDLHIPYQINYAVGAAAGSINTATLVLDEFTVHNQAYLKVEATDAHPAGQGIMGLGPGSTSPIRKLVMNASTTIDGSTPLDRIFKQDVTIPNFITILLSREISENDVLDGGNNQNGQFTIGEVVPSLSGIASVPKLPALVDDYVQYGNQHWETILDVNGIIGPDGIEIETVTSLQSDTKNAYGSNQLHVMFDTGFTYPQVPGAVADGIYGRIPSAQFVPQTDSPGYWTFDCKYELNVTFLFSGVHYPIHPLDLGTPIDDSGVTCAATFRERMNILSDHTRFGSIDAILGMAFLRNTYLLINFGDFVQGTSITVPPYMQLLSTTDRDKAHHEFVKVRLNGVDTTRSQQPLLSKMGSKSTKGSGNKSSAESDLSTTNSTSGAINMSKKTWYIVGAVAAGTLLLFTVVAVIAAKIVRRRNQGRSGPGGSGYRPSTKDSMGSYKPLEDPHTQPSEKPWSKDDYPYSEPEYRYNA